MTHAAANKRETVLRVGQTLQQCYKKAPASHLASVVKMLCGMLVAINSAPANGSFIWICAAVLLTFECMAARIGSHQHREVGTTVQQYCCTAVTIGCIRKRNTWTNFQSARILHGDQENAG
ncbi:unnamed protein product [Ectocarpus sp. 12 AP-2014]